MIRERERDSIPSITHCCISQPKQRIKKTLPSSQHNPFSTPPPSPPYTLLTPTPLLQSLGHVYEYHALDLIFHYMQVRKVGNARLSFEGLRFLGSLLFHKKFCLEFVNMGGIQELLKVREGEKEMDGSGGCSDV